MKHAPGFLLALDALQRGEIEIVYPPSVFPDPDIGSMYVKPQPPRLKFGDMDYAEFARHIREVIEHVDDRDKTIAKLRSNLESIHLISKVAA